MYVRVYHIVDYSSPVKRSRIIRIGSFYTVHKRKMRSDRSHCVYTNNYEPRLQIRFDIHDSVSAGLANEARIHVSARKHCEESKKRWGEFLTLHLWRFTPPSNGDTSTGAFFHPFFVEQNTEKGNRTKCVKIARVPKRNDEEIRDPNKRWNTIRDYMASNITITSRYVGALTKKFSNVRQISYKNDMICSLEK